MAFSRNRSAYSPKPIDASHSAIPVMAHLWADNSTLERHAAHPGIAGPCGEEGSMDCHHSRNETTMAPACSSRHRCGHLIIIRTRSSQTSARV